MIVNCAWLVLTGILNRFEMVILLGQSLKAVCLESTRAAAMGCRPVRPLVVCDKRQWAFPARPVAYNISDLCLAAMCVCVCVRCVSHVPCAHTHIFRIGRFGLCFPTVAQGIYVNAYMPLLSGETCVKILCGRSMQVSGFLRFAIPPFSVSCCRPTKKNAQNARVYKCTTPSAGGKLVNRPNR